MAADVSCRSARPWPGNGGVERICKETELNSGGVLCNTLSALIACSTRNYPVNRSMTARASFGLLWTCGISLRLTVLAVPPVISLIQRALNPSGTEIGLLSGIPVVVFAIFAAPGSIVIARMGARVALVSGLLIGGRRDVASLRGVKRVAIVPDDDAHERWDCHYAAGWQGLPRCGEWVPKRSAYFWKRPFTPTA